jgi:hypothetical protein
VTAPSEEIVAQVRRETGPQTILSFSRGKDAIAAYIAIRDSFEHIAPYHLYLVPGLEFVEESIAYYEKVMGRHIIQLPHPSLYRHLRAFIFQTPGNAAVIQAANLPSFDYLNIHQMVCEIEGLDPDVALVASGVRAADSPIRRLQFSSHGAISPKQRQYYPVWDWNKERLIDALKRSGIMLPEDYHLFGRTFDGVDLRFTYPIKKHRPRDYARILEFYPLAEIEIWRYEKALAA